MAPLPEWVAPLDRNTQQMMKSQYAEGLMQLAFGYRFLKLGAQNLEFEPEAQGGKLGDIFFKLEGNYYMVECYIPRNKSYMDSSMEIQYCVGPIFKAADSVNKIVKVYIALKKSIGQQERKEIQRMVINAIKQPTQYKHLDIENAFAKVAIDDIKNMKENNDFLLSNLTNSYGKPDWEMRQRKVPRNRKTILQVRKGEYKYEGIHSVVLGEGPESEKKELSPGERIKELTKKIENKLVQTRTVNNQARRIIIAEVVEGRKLIAERDTNSAHICHQIQQKIISKHSNVSALFLCVRTWTEKMRHIYIGVILLGREKDAISNQLINKLIDVENRTEWLNDWR
ncbi:MAG: hypothetical protein ABII89_03020 [Candidatus Omnitrophota bacterium]